MRKLFSQGKKIAKSVQEQVRNAFRGVLNVTNSSPDVQLVQVSGLADETLQDVELMQHFGFTSVPPEGTQAIVIPLGGKTTHGIVVATENGSFRVKSLKSGETAIYDSSGSTIVLKNGRVIEVECDAFQVSCKTVKMSCDSVQMQCSDYTVSASSEAVFNTPNLQTSQTLTALGLIAGNGGLAVQGGSGATFSGDVVQKSGSFTTNGDVVAGGTSLKTHKHTEQGDGRPTSVPIS